MSKNALFLIPFFMAFTLCAMSAVWFVDDTTDPLEDGSFLHPFDGIQEGLDAAVGTDTVLVLDGVYTGAANKNLDFKGKGLTLISQSGPSNAVIDCQGNGRGFYFHSGEPTNALLSGFTIRHANSIAVMNSPIKIFGSEMSGIFIVSNSNPLIENCHIVSNWAVASIATQTVVIGLSNSLKEISVGSHSLGGGIYCASSSPVFRDCLIADNLAGWHGGGIACFSNSVLTLDHCEIRRNDCGLGGVIGTNFFMPAQEFIHDLSGNGGGVYSRNSTLIIKDSMIYGNSAGESGGGICIDGGGGTIGTNAFIFHNTSGLNGGGMILFSNAVVQLDDVYLIGNRCASGWIDTSQTVMGPGGGPIELRRRRFEGTGGGIHSKGASISIHRSFLSGNQAGDFGGGGFFESNQVARIADSFVQGNHLRSTYCRGGGLYFTNDQPFISSSSIQGNQAFAIREDGSQTVVIGGGEETATESAVSYAGMGGGLCIQDGRLFMSNCLMEANTGGRKGGGLYMGNCFTSKFVSCRFRYNQTIGSQMGVSSCQSVWAGTDILYEFLEESFSGGSGLGAVFIHDSEIEMEACEISENLLGGGLSLDSCSNALFRNLVVYRNTAHLNSSLHLVSSTSCSHNVSTEVNVSEPRTRPLSVITDEGEGVFLKNSSPVFEHCTIVEHEHPMTNVGMIATATSMPTLVNCIVWHSGLNISTSSTVTISHSLIEGGFPGPGNLDVDPALTQGWRLKCTSPCIDAATNGMVMTDYDGEARFDHPAFSNLISIFDIGADEFVDLDADDLADQWELEFFMGLTNFSGLSDSDGDGLSNKEEYNHSTFPDDVDTDNDMIPDGWEVRRGLDPVQYDYSDDDNDLDLRSNYEEYIADTDPLDAASQLTLAIHRTLDPAIQGLSFASSSNRHYWIERSTNLYQSGWGVTRTNIVGSGSLVLQTDTNLFDRAYYRLGVEVP